MIDERQRSIGQEQAAEWLEHLDTASRRHILWTAILVGVGLRILVSVVGDVGCYVDGASRIANAMGWAEHPYWAGVSGVWPPAQWYFLGFFLRIWNQPVVLAKIVSLAFGVAGLFAFRSAVRASFSEEIAVVAMLLLAVYWTHIWLTSSYWSELPYLFFVFAAVGAAIRGAAGDQLSSFKAGIYIASAILLRNEGIGILALFIAWHLLNVKGFAKVASFAVPPVLLSVWCFIEPWLRGHSYVDYFTLINQAKQAENLMTGFGVKKSLETWMLMLGAAPSFFVIGPGIYGFFRARAAWRRDLFAWMFVSQVLFYMTLTLFAGWRPQLRYLLVYFTGLLPYCAIGWLAVARRSNRGYALALLLAVTLSTQAVGWWIGRNQWREWGWLPIQVRTDSQAAVDGLVDNIIARGVTGLRLASIVPASPAERWSLMHSRVVSRVSADQIQLLEFYAQVDPRILAGKPPEAAAAADIVLIDPTVIFYPGIAAELRRAVPGMTGVPLHPHVSALLLSGRARALLQTNSRSVNPDPEGVCFAGPGDGLQARLASLSCPFSINLALSSSSVRRSISYTTSRTGPCNKRHRTRAPKTGPVVIRRARLYIEFLA